MDPQIVNIAQDISNCILFLGPELHLTSDGKSHKEFFRELVQNNDGVKYFDRDNLFWLQSNSPSTGSARPNLNFISLSSKIKQFYDSAHNDELFSMLAKIPFSLVVNVCPDRHLKQEFDKKKLPIREVVASDPRDPNMKPPTPESPVIYYVMGRVDKSQSLVLTHRDLFKGIRALLQNDFIPEQILTTLKNAASYLFLGFHFGTWYYQLLLSLVDDDLKSLRIGAPIETDQDVVSIMTSHFRLEFFQEDPLPFIKQLFTQLSDSGIGLRIPKDRGRVYFSYGWEQADQSTGEWFVDLLQIDMSATEGVTFYRDKNVMTFQDSITGFMSQIGLANTVVMVISNKYLTSPYCLTEAWRVYHNQNFKDRVFLAALEDVDFSDAGIKFYVDYWNQRLSQIQDITSSEEYRNNLAVILPQIQQQQNFQEINLFISEFLHYIRDRIHLRLPAEPFSLALAPPKYLEFKKIICERLDKPIVL